MFAFDYTACCLYKVLPGVREKFDFWLGVAEKDQGRLLPPFSLQGGGGVAFQHQGARL